MRRRRQILRIVQQEPIHSQDELAEILDRTGVHVTQPTLSRDIRELGLAKSAAGYVIPAAPPSPVLPFVHAVHGESRLEQAVVEFAVTIERAGNLVVIKTPPAGAQPLALALDNASLPSVLGSIAGDDTIFIAVRTASAATALTRRLREAIESRPARRTRA